MARPTGTGSPHAPPLRGSLPPQGANSPWGGPAANCIGKPSGFTLIELLVVLAIMATLLTIVAPRYFQRVDGAKEVVLKQNLHGLREVLDKYKADTGKFPEALDELVQKRYLREVPLDPITERRDTWVPVPRQGETGITDVKSGAEGNATNGTAFKTW